MTDIFKILVLAASVSWLAGCGIDQPELDDSSEVTTESGDTGGDTGGGTGGETDGGESSGEEEISNGATDLDFGPPDADSFSLSVDNAVVADAYDYDGKTTALNVRVGDRNNHAVADGTKVSFWTEYGLITDSCVTTGGGCSVTWISGGYRPKDGLSTVVAYTLGEDSFIDTDERNAIYNVAGDLPEWASDETILSSPELYYDRNFDGYDANSFADAGSGVTLESDAFEDLNGNDSFDSSSDKFRGTSCSAGALSEGHCEQTEIHVWTHTQLALDQSDDQPTVAVDAGPWDQGTTYEVSVADSFGNYPVEGTAIEVTSESGTFKVQFPDGSSVPSVGVATAAPHVFNVVVTDTAGPGTATIMITSGLATAVETVDYN